MRNLGLFAIVVVALVAAVPASSQPVAVDGRWVDAGAVPEVQSARLGVDAPGDSSDPNWGTDPYITYEAAACDAALRAGAWGEHSCAYVQSTSASSVSVGYPIHIPSGAIASYVRIYFNETALSEGISAGFWRFDDFGGMGSIQGASPTATTAGDTYVDFGPFSEVINNAPTTGYTYQILAITHGATRIYKFTVYYKLQVSPAPATATFTDVPVGAFAFQHIEALVASGITAGCGGGNFCPNTPVTRAQMAVFLAKALGLHFQY